ncbi:MAG: hypothetical protein HY724_03730 [Candidatus Rokubacteria bacterium]|nr:hypothetical protein [Candidatus Rokubacteria bacterium]
MREPILIAEDDPVLALVLNGYLARLGFAVHTTDSFQEASRWLERDGGPLVLDGSVFKRMGTPLGELSKRVIIWSGDWELVQEARELGLRALYKGNLKDIDGLLREMAGPERSKS